MIQDSVMRRFLHTGSCRDSQNEAAAKPEPAFGPKSSGFDGRTACRPNGNIRSGPDSRVQATDTYTSPTGSVKGLTVNEAIAVMAEVSKGLSSKGNGDIFYWKLSSENMVMSARVLGDFFLQLASRVEDKTLRVGMGGVANQLASYRSSVSGDILYWMHSTSKIKNTVDEVFSSMSTFAAALNSSEPIVSAPELLKTLSKLLKSVENSGWYNRDCCRKDAQDVAALANSIGRALDLSKNKLSQSAQVVVGDIAQKLKLLSDQGSGDYVYWSKKTKDLTKKAKELANQLDQVADTL